MIIKEFLARDACSECDYYIPENGICQSKKCCTSGNHPYVNWIDRKFCKPYKAERRDE